MPARPELAAQAHMHTWRVWAVQLLALCASLALLCLSWGRSSSCGSAQSNLTAAAGWQPRRTQQLSTAAYSPQAQPQQVTNRTLYILRASHAPLGVLRLFQQMQADLGADSVFLTFDDTHSSWPHGPAIRMTEQRNSSRGGPAPHVLLFNRSEAEALVGQVSKWMNYYDQPALALFHRHMSGTPYAFLWRFEADVRCNGAYSECLAGTAALPHDLLCSVEPLRYADIPGWPHWGKLSGRLASVPQQDRIECFMPLMRISRRALELVGRELQQSGGFLEVFYPTLLEQHGNFTVGAVPPHDVGIVRWESPGQLSLTAEYQHLSSLHRDNRLYHPVKDWD